MPHLKIKPFSFDCGASPSALSMQTMQPMQPRLVLQQAVLRQPAVLLHARPAQPWLVGQVQHQLPAQLKTVSAGPMAMPVAMPTPIVKTVVKPVAKPSQWVYAAPLHSTSGHQKPNTGLPKPQLLSMKVTTPQRKELPLIDGQVPRDAGVEGMHPVDFKTFWEQSFFKIFKFLSICLVVPVGFTCISWVPRDSLMLVCTSEVMVFPCFVATRFCILWISLVCPSLGISKIWLWSTFAVKTAQAATSQGQFMFRPWISSRRSRRM